MSSMIDTETRASLDAFNKSEIARRMNMHRDTISNWKELGWHIPAEYVVRFEQATGIARERLRPEMYEGFVRCPPPAPF